MRARAGGGGIGVGAHKPNRIPKKNVIANTKKHTVL